MFEACRNRRDLKDAHVIEMAQPEGAAWLYYWEGNEFSKLWLTD